MKSIATCCCGNTCIEILGKPLVNAVCHCNDCKKRTGSAFGISVYVRDSQISQKNGKTHIYTINNKSRQERHFCQNCGTTLFWKISHFPELTGIAGGCFSNLEQLEPEYTVSNEGKCRWLTLPKNWKTSLNQDAFQ